MDTVRRSPLCKKFIGFTALYSPLDIEYQQAYSGPYKDLSYYGDDAVIIAAIKDGVISGFGRPVVAFGTDRALRGGVQRLYEISPKIWYQDFLEGERVSAAGRFLQERGLAARPFYTQIIDLTKTKEELHADLRKSFTSLINNRLPNVQIYPASYLLSLKTLHAKVHSRQTRPDETWHIQRKMIESNKAFLVADVEDNNYEVNPLLSGALFYHNGQSCYYACAASVEGTQSHAVLWTAILTAKSLGCKTFELGERVFHPSGVDGQGYPCDEKAVNVSKFKAGFGGQTKVYLRIGEK